MTAKIRNFYDWSADVKVGPLPIFVPWSLSFGELCNAWLWNGASSGSFCFLIKKTEALRKKMMPTSTISRPVEIGLRLTGIWPNSPILFRLLWTIVMGTGLIFQYKYILSHFSTTELSNLIDGLSTTLPYNLLFFKLITLWVKNRYAYSSCIFLLCWNSSLRQSFLVQYVLNC